MPDSRWKRAERELATLFGTTRLANVGKGQPDFRTDKYAVQVKTRLTLPAWLTDAVAQACRDCTPGELPIVVLNEVSQGRKARRLLVLDLDAWMAAEPKEGADDAA